MSRPKWIALAAVTVAVAGILAAVTRDDGGGSGGRLADTVSIPKLASGQIEVGASTFLLADYASEGGLDLAIITVEGDQLRSTDPTTVASSASFEGFEARELPEGGWLIVGSGCLSLAADNEMCPESGTLAYLLDTDGTTSKVGLIAGSDQETVHIAGFIDQTTAVLHAGGNRQVDDGTNNLVYSGSVDLLDLKNGETSRVDWKPEDMRYDPGAVSGLATDTAQQESCVIGETMYLLRSDPSADGSPVRTLTTLPLLRPDTASSVGVVFPPEVLDIGNLFCGPGPEIEVLVGHADGATFSGSGTLSVFPLDPDGRVGEPQSHTYSGMIHSNGSGPSSVFYEVGPLLGEEGPHSMFRFGSDGWRVVAEELPKSERRWIDDSGSMIVRHGVDGYRVAPL